MAWVAVDRCGTETIFEDKPIYRNKSGGYWVSYDTLHWRKYGIILPKGSIKKLIGRDLSWEDNPVELKEE